MSRTILHWGSRIDLEYSARGKKWKCDTDGGYLDALDAIPGTEERSWRTWLPHWSSTNASWPLWPKLRTSEESETGSVGGARYLETSPFTINSMYHHHSVDDYLWEERYWKLQKEGLEMDETLISGRQALWHPQGAIRRQARWLHSRAESSQQERRQCTNGCGWASRKQVLKLAFSITFEDLDCRGSLSLMNQTTPFPSTGDTIHPVLGMGVVCLVHKTRVP